MINISDRAEENHNYISTDNVIIHVKQNKSLMQLSKDVKIMCHEFYKQQMN